MATKKSSNKFFKYLVFAVVLFIPFIYSFFYLKSYWDPYGNMNNIPVAIVNEDEGEQGAKVAKALKDKDVLKLTETSASDAADGLEHEKYYATVTLPKTFSKDLLSASTEDKTPATILYSPNQKSNYLASQIINRVVLGAETSVRSEVASNVVTNLSDKLDQVPGKLQQIADGATQLETGSTSLTSGLGTLNSGLNTLTFGLGTLNSGAHQLDNGIALINTALASADTSKISDLTTGISQLRTGAAQLNQGTTTYVQNVETFAGGVKQLDAKVNSAITEFSQKCEPYQSLDLVYSVCTAIIGQITDKLNEKILNNPDYRQLIAGANALTTPSPAYGNQTPGQSLASGAAQLNAGTSALNDSIDQINGLGSSLDQLKSHLQEVKSATSQLSDGAAQLTNGSQQLASGSSQALSGSQQLTNGLNTLKTSVVDGIDTTKDQLKVLNGLADFTANPVNIKEEDYGQVDAYGISFTPLFISIGLWVGALMCYVVLYFDQDHRFGIFDKKNRGLKQNFAFLGVSVGFGLLTAFLLKTFINFEVTDTFKYYLDAALIAATFMAIIQLLIRIFGDAGKFLALIILVLQLAASGGTFPVETIAAGFRWLNPLLPMTYSIRLVKESVISVTDGVSFANASVLLGILIVCVIITTVYDLTVTSKSSQSAPAVV